MMIPKNKTPMMKRNLWRLGGVILPLALAAACGGSDDEDTTAPEVSSNVPADAATGVALDGSLAVTFSEAMDPLTITTSTFTLKQGAMAVTGAVSYAGVTATFNPTNALVANTSFTATVTTGAQDLAGNALAASHEWSFTTGAAADTTVPMVSSTVPADAAIDVAVGGNIAVTFSEAMDPLTITTSTFTLNQGAMAVTGAVSYAGVTATFNPTSALSADTSFTATITTGAQDLAGNALAASHEWSFTTGAAADTTAPTVSSTVPENVATNVAVGGNIAVTFSEAMNPLTITTSTFTLKQGAMAVAGAVSYAGVTATFNPTFALAANTSFTATITTGAQDLAGNALAASHEWSFTTGAAADTTAPTVSSTAPADAAIDVAMDGNIAVTFSEAMNPLTVTTASLTLEQGATAIVGSVTYVGIIATFNPTSDLAESTVYTATVTTAAQDLAGNALAADHVWSFTTGLVLDIDVPRVLGATPADGAVDVAINRNLAVDFSEVMNATTLTTATFTVEGPGTTPVSGAVTYSGTRAVFNPSANLTTGTLFHAVITTGATDLAANALASDFAWSFTTGTDVALGPDPVLLGLAGDYVVLAKSGVDTVPGSAITGNLGVSPIDSTGITGFSLTMDSGNEYSTSIQVTGQVRAADYAVPTPSNLTTAVSDMMTAYTDAAGRPTPDFSELGAGEIGGLTLAPGLYKWGTGVSIATDVTLDGGPNDVWIFQIAGDVTQANGTSVTLIGGALPKNIFWQTFGQLMIGTTAHFEGIGLCQTAIVLGTGASANARLLAQTAVTLDQNAVTQPSL